MDEDIHENLYNEIMEQFESYHNVYSHLYRLNTNDEKEIDTLFQEINNYLIVTKINLPVQVLSKLSIIAAYNNRYLKSYWSLFKKIYSKYRPKPAAFLSSFFKYLFYKEYNIYWDEESKDVVQRYQFDEFSSFLVCEDYNLIKNTIYQAIVDDNICLFVTLIEGGFDEKQMIKKGYFPFSAAGYSLLELCCYYESVRCFKFLRTKFDSKISQKCLQFSFLRRNCDIINECLKEIKPDKETMKNAIISHLNDYVTYLMNEHDLTINVEYCCKYNNLQAFAIYLQETNDINNCFIYSPWFNIPKLCEYLILHGADVNIKDKRKNNALFLVQDPLSLETIEILLNHGIDYKSIDWRQQTILHIYVANNMYEQAKLLLERCPDINVNAVDKYKLTPLHVAAGKSSAQIIELLLNYGAEVNAQDVTGETPLQKAVSTSNIEVIKLLINNGADINMEDDNGITALQIAARKNCQIVIQFFTSQGLCFNEKSKIDCF